MLALMLVLGAGAGSVLVPLHPGLCVSSTLSKQHSLGGPPSPVSNEQSVLCSGLCVLFGSANLPFVVVMVVSFPLLECPSPMPYQPFCMAKRTILFVKPHLGFVWSCAKGFKGLAFQSQMYRKTPLQAVRTQCT